MEQDPLITIITVTYNAEKSIGITLDSIKNQSYSGYQHLVIDGKSSDNTISLVKDAGTDRTEILCEPDKGLYDAMNKGLKLARGKYVIFLNAGDAFASSETLAHYAKEALKDKDIIYGDTDIVDKSCQRISGRHLKAPKKLTKGCFAHGMLICHQAFMVKKDLTPSYDLSYRFSADYDWCVKCIGASDPENCVNLNEVTVNFLSDGLTDKNKWKSLGERFGIMSIHYGFFPTAFRHIGFIFRALKRGKL